VQIQTEHLFSPLHLLLVQHQAVEVYTTAEVTSTFKTKVPIG